MDKKRTWSFIIVLDPAKLLYFRGIKLCCYSSMRETVDYILREEQVDLKSNSSCRYIGINSDGSAWFSICPHQFHITTKMCSRMKPIELKQEVRTLTAPRQVDDAVQHDQYFSYKFRASSGCRYRYCNPERKAMITTPSRSQARIMEHHQTNCRSYWPSKAWEPNWPQKRLVCLFTD